MKRQLFAEYTGNQLLQILEDNAEKIIDNHSFERPLTDDEVTTFKDMLADNMIEVSQMET